MNRFLSSREHLNIFSNVSWVLSERLVRVLAGLFVGVLIARTLGPEKYGYLSYALSYIALFVPVATLGLDSITVKELVTHPEQRNQILGTTFFLKLGGSLTLLLFVAISLSFQESNSSSALIAIIAIAPIFQSLNVVDFHFQANVKSKYVAKAQIIQLGFSSILKLFLIYIQAPLIYFAWLYVLDSLLLAALLLITYSNRNGTALYWKPEFHLGQRLLRQSWPLMLSGLTVTIYMRIDQVMINHMVNSTEVGYYSAATTLSEAFYFLPVAVCASMFPSIIHLFKTDKIKYTLRMEKIYGLMIWLGLILAITTSFLSTWLIEFLYGADYIKSAAILNIHIWAAIFVFLGVASGKQLVTEGMQLRAFFRTFAGAIINIMLNYILISKYQSVGAAWSTLISYAVAGYLYDLLDPRTRGIFMSKTRSVITLWK